MYLERNINNVTNWQVISRACMEEGRSLCYT